MKERMEGQVVEGRMPREEGLGQLQQHLQQQQVATTTTTAGADEATEDVNGNPTNALDTQQQASRGGPRLISISRTDQGFGFTLRHFIVYPPELSELLGEDVVVVSPPAPLSSLDPLDTIFVKHVRPGSPSHLAGLRTGDRVVSVNGESVGNRSYQEVVATIHRSPPTLQLLVVPREQDLLQQVFGETAHNPESNLDVRMPSPSHLPPQHLVRHPGSAAQPAFGTLAAQYPPSLSSAWSSQSSLASHPSAMSTGTHPPAVIMAHPPYHPRPHQPSKGSQPHGAHIPIHPHHRGNQSVPYRAGSRKHSLSAGGEKQSPVNPGNRKQSLPGSADRRQAIYTLQNTIPTVPHQVPLGKSKQSPSPVSTNQPGNMLSIPGSDQLTGSVFGVYEPILDRAVGRGSFKDNRRFERDPDGLIYEVVQTKVVESKINSGDVSKSKQGKDHNQGSHVARKTSLGNEVDAKRVRVQSLSPPRLRLDQIHARSVSVHTRPENFGYDTNIHGSQQSLDSTKSEVLVRSSNKPNSYSRRSYTEPIYSNKENCHANDKSTQDVINRIKRNVERKEEFLKRPNQPIWLPASKPPLIHTDYHVNPQKLPKPLWPPPSAQTPPSPGAVTKALTFIVAPKEKAQKAKLDMDTSLIINGSPSSQNDEKGESFAYEADYANVNNCDNYSPGASNHRSLVGNSVPKPYVGSSSEVSPASGRYGKGFTSTLSRIQENIPIPELGSSSSLGSQGMCSSRQSDTPPGSEKSFMTSVIRPIPLAWVGDNERIKQLQIVSKRAKQFENSQLEKEASAKSAFHRFELTRLSQRSRTPNVAQRKQEFEKRDSDQFGSCFDFEFGTNYSNTPRQRKSAELVRCTLVSKELSPSPPKVFRSLSDGGSVFPVSRRFYAPGYDDDSGSPGSTGEPEVRMGMNRMIPIGSSHIHCQPPSHYSGTQRPQSDSDVLERERSNSVCSQASMSSLWSTQSMDETGTAKQKSVARQNSYLSALRSPLADAGQHSDPNSPPTAAPGTTTTSTTTTIPTTTTTITPPYPDHHSHPRPKRPTFLPIKNHARPTQQGSGADPGAGGYRGPHETTPLIPLARSTSMKVPSCASLSRLPISMYQLPAVVTPSVVTPGALEMTGPTSAPSSLPTGANTPINVHVARRNKAVYGEEGERLVRRVSYLKATSGDRMYTDSDIDSDIDDKRGERVEVGTVVEGVVTTNNNTNNANNNNSNNLATPGTPAGPLCVSELPSPASLQSAILRQGALHVKLTMVDGKKAGDRSWKTVWAVVQGRALVFYKDRQHALQTPLGVEEQISLRGSEVEVASDYTKRRNVLRLATPGGSQLLLQADTPPEMLGWLSTLQNNCTVQEGESESKGPTTNNNNVSPQAGNKAIRKLTSLRTRSPTGQSPSTKSRKPGAAESNTSPKSKTWSHIKRPFMKKSHSGSPAATPTALPLPEGATIGVCLEDCPTSQEHEYVPLLVALCVSVVETRGLQTQGIYRIPGNKAAVNNLTEMINRDFKCIDYDDSRWTDVNVISSMLKQFFQKLPDPLFTSELYPLFIEASKCDEPSQRMVELKKMILELPDYHYETLRFLILHLNNIVANSDLNKMDVRNLAIVFGPTLVRSGDDNMVTMVTDMSHQCRIVESLISHALWFFSEDDGEDLSPPLMPDPSHSQSPTTDCLGLPPPESDTPSSQALLLHNIPKVEGNLKSDMKKDIVSSIISAANRKVHKVKYRKPLEEKPVDESKYSDKEGGFEERDIDKEAELRKQRLHAKHMESMVELPDPKPMSERKISNMSLMSVQSQLSGVSNVSQSQSNERTSGIMEQGKLSLPSDDSRLFSPDRKDGLSDSSVPLTLPSVSTANATQQSSQMNPEASSLFGDEVAIRSYAGLSASTQERIRRFKMETLAMLHRDVTRHRRETERRDLERQRLEELWQRAKQDMESEDILDQLADNPTEVVRKIPDYSWRLQGLSEGVVGGGERGSVVGPHLVSAALSHHHQQHHHHHHHHHPLSNTPLTPTTNAISQVSNTHLQLPIIKVPNDPAAIGKACDATNETRHGMLPQNSLAWLDYNAASSPHNTLGSTCSSASSGYGSLTRSSHANNNPIYNDDMTGRSADEAYSTESCRPRPFSVSQQSSPSNSKKKKSSKGSGFFFGLSSSSSSPSLFPSMAEAELTPTRKIGQTTIYPESPRPPPHRPHPSSQLHPPILVPPQVAPQAAPARHHKESILHHILPSRLYHSPRPLRRGSSAESVTEQPTTTTTTPLSPSIYNSQRVVNNGTLRRARGSRDQIINGSEAGVPRCGSLDSLRDSPHVPHDDGSDLLSAITATFEEKMRSLQESPLGLVVSGGDLPCTPGQEPPSPPSLAPSPPPPTTTEPSHHPRGSSSSSSACRLYRDPSLHRRRTNPRTNADSQGDDLSHSKKKEKDNKLHKEEGKKEVKVKRSDSLTKSEKTENNLKEKTEKRARELKRTDTQDSLSEKKPKEMKRSGNEGTERSRDPSKKSETKDSSVGSTRRTSDLRSRKHNVKELKEKFEQNTTTSQSGPSAMKPSNGVYGGGGGKGNKSGTRRNHRGPIKRRHTVGGTKDLAKWAWVHSGEGGGRSQSRATRLTAWERLQPMVADERLNTDRSLEAWLAHERIRTSSPDLSRPQQLVLPCHTDDKENLHRRLSVQEAALNALYPVLESHV